MKGTLFFDVNETLLDTTVLLEYASERLSHRQDLADIWFTSLLHHSLVTSVTNSWYGFGEIAEAVLKMTARRYGISLKKSEYSLSEVISSLPAHPDVAEGLSSLKQSGFELAALTNSSDEMAKIQLRKAGIDYSFTHILSVEQIGTYKPDLRVYRWAANLVGKPVSDCMMVAAHGWDVGGAKLAGMKTAFIARNGQALYPLAPEPDLIASNITHLSQIINP